MSLSGTAGGGGARDPYNSKVEVGKAASFLKTFPFPPNTVNPPDFASHLRLAREASKSGLWSDFRDIDLFVPVGGYRGG